MFVWHVLNCSCTWVCIFKQKMCVRRFPSRSISGFENAHKRFKWGLQIVSLILFFRLTSGCCFNEYNDDGKCKGNRWRFQCLLKCKGCTICNVYCKTFFSNIEINITSLQIHTIILCIHFWNEPQYIDFGKHLTSEVLTDA